MSNRRACRFMMTSHAYDRALERMGLDCDQFDEWFDEAWLQPVPVCYANANRVRVDMDCNRNVLYQHPFIHGDHDAVLFVTKGRWIVTLISFKEIAPMPKIDEDEDDAFFDPALRLVAFDQRDQSCVDAMRFYRAGLLTVDGLRYVINRGESGRRDRLEQALSQAAGA